MAKRISKALHMKKGSMLVCALILACLIPALFAEDIPAATKTPVRVWIKNKHATPDWSFPVGDVYVEYKDGTTDRWTTHGNCMQPQLGPGGMVAWIVCREKPDGKLDLYRNVPIGSELRVFHMGKVIAKIEAERPFIEEFRFETDGRFVVVKSRHAHGPATIQRCETAGGKIVESTKAYADPAKGETLPVWARDMAD